MLSHCSNSQCGKPFLRLGEGKLFQVEAGYADGGLAGSHAPDLRKPPRSVERYWLCDACTELWTLVQDRNCRISLVHLPVPPVGASPTARELTGEMADQVLLDS
jgi:hypothetical protein